MQKRLLPLVSQDVGKAMQVDMLEQKDNQYVVEVLEKLKKENPCIANFIGSFSVTASRDPVATAYCGVLVYKMLQNQAEADELKKSLG